MSSDDFEADLSFSKRKKELQSLYKEFQSALTQMKSFPDFSVNEDNEPSTKSSFHQIHDPSEASQIQMNYDIRSLICEIQSLRHETIEIKDSLQRAAKGKMRSRIIQILDKVDSLNRILSSHMARAQAILNYIQKVQ